MLERLLEMAHDDVFQAEKRCARQMHLVASMRAGGRDVAAAEATLRDMCGALAWMREDEQWLEALIAKRQPANQEARTGALGGVAHAGLDLS